MTYPKVGDEAFTEQEGEIAVQSAVNRARCVWRKTSTRDVGIDGQIEYIDAEGNATGRIVAVQVKSGASYFPKGTDDDLTYPVPLKHRDYWRDFPLPVIGGLGIGADAFAFIDRYVSFLVAYNLARVDFDAFRRFAVQYGMVGRILAPLTDRGQHLIGIVDEVDDRLSPNWPSRVAQDRAIQMVFTDLPERTGRLEEFKRVFGGAAT